MVDDGSYGDMQGDGAQEAEGLYSSAEESKESEASVQEFISGWIAKIDKAEKHWKDDFDRMLEDQEFASGKQWPNMTEKDDRYVANFVQQVVRQRVSALYAKNPTVVAKRKTRQNFKIWDGKQQSLQSALQSLQANPMDISASMLLQDVTEGKNMMEKLDSICKTLEIVCRHYMLEQQPNFKRMMKRLVRRAETCGVGYLKLDFQRELEPRPDVESQIADLTTQLSQIEMLLSQEEAEDFDSNSAKSEELRASIDALQQKKFTIVREGPVFSFPKATSLIIDDCCTQLEGFLGAGWVAERFWLTKDEVERIYQVKCDGSDNYDEKPSSVVYPDKDKKDERKKGLKCVYEVHNKFSGTKFTIMRGYKKYLKEPAAPEIAIECPFPYFPLTFNDVENEDTIFPPSSVRLLWHVQTERNRNKEALRQHRIAKAPKYGGIGSAVSTEDRLKISTAPAHHVTWFDSVQPGQKSEDLFWEIKTQNIDPNVYEVGSLTEDVSMVVGSPATNLGLTTGSTATESSIAEDSRMSTISSNTDDLDDFLTILFGEVGHMLLLELSPETVTKIAGPGATWPEFSVEDIINDIYLEIEAGSSGRPNRAMEVSVMKELFPILIQIPGISPEFLARKLLKTMDEAVDLQEAWIDGMPSVNALNSLMGSAQAAPGAGVNGAQGAQATGDPATDPSMQGARGANKTPAVSPQSNIGDINRGLMQR